ncbi:MAG: hypothetical protein IKN54_02210 [Lachnospiraceae bacterium]|nr:hypothetical protein [Lachnospiraceae bacterium]
MTNFDKARQSPCDMAIVILFCVAANQEQSQDTKFSDEEIKDFINNNIECVVEWLNMEEPKVKA